MISNPIEDYKDKMGTRNSRDTYKLFMWTMLYWMWEAI